MSTTPFQQVRRFDIDFSQFINRQRQSLTRDLIIPELLQDLPRPKFNELLLKLKLLFMLPLLIFLLQPLRVVILSAVVLRKLEILTLILVFQQLGPLTPI